MKLGGSVEFLSLLLSSLLHQSLQWMMSCEERGMTDLEGVASQRGPMEKDDNVNNNLGLYTNSYDIRSLISPLQISLQ